MAPTVLEGTWPEIAARADELREGRWRVTRVDEAGDGPPGPDDPRALTPAERLQRVRAMHERFREEDKGKTPVPGRIFTVDDFYPDED